jgi:phage replication-related protein YjqB (UPF0714/DUF867 family)
LNSRLAWLLVLVAAAAAAITGCGPVEREQAAFTEKLLADAGFRRVPENETLAGLPPREIVARSQGGKIVYLYSDIENCRCVYLGSPEAYSRYQDWMEGVEIARAMTWNDY